MRCDNLMKFENLLYTFILFSCMTILLGCGQKNDLHPVAKAYGHVLLWDAVEPFLQQTKSPDDSLLRLKKIVDSWINQEIKLNAASRALNQKDLDIEAKVNTYKNDLLVYYFEQNKIAELLDTAVNESEMKTMFEKNKENFHLSNNVVRLVFVKIKSDLKIIPKLRNLLGNFTPDNHAKIEELSSQYAENSFLEDQVWLNFDDITKEVPIKTYDAEHFLENNKYFEISEGPYLYLVNILAYQIKNTTSKFEFERENIKKVILQNRKNELLKQLELTLKKEAELKNEIESFVKLK